MPVITLPDGSRREYDRPVTALEVAESIGAGLARAAIAARVDQSLVDLTRPIAADAVLSIVTARDPEGIEVIRHSTAHLLAQAVKTLFPGAQVTIGDQTFAQAEPGGRTTTQRLPCSGTSRSSTNSKPSLPT